MKIIGIGDNVADCYLDQGKFYPGGNAVNVAVNCRRFGMEEAAYLGIFGDDGKARHIRDVLRQEKIDISRCRKFYGISGQPAIRIDEQGDRVFSKKFFYTCQNAVSLRFIQADIDYIGQFDLAHTSCYSFIEPELARIRAVCDVSYDFSDIYTKQYIEEVCPFVRYAFFSGSHLSDEEVLAIISLAHQMGCEIVGMTLGSKGAIFSKGGKLYKEGIREGDVVDTMGAGDSFIAGFLTEYTRSYEMEKALAYAADRAAETCGHFGAIGYPAAL